MYICLLIQPIIRNRIRRTHAIFMQKLFLVFRVFFKKREKREKVRTCEYKLVLYEAVSGMCGSRFHIRIVSSLEHVKNELGGRMGVSPASNIGYTCK